MASMPACLLKSRLLLLFLTEMVKRHEQEGDHKAYQGLLAGLDCLIMVKSWKKKGRNRYVLWSAQVRGVLCCVKLHQSALSTGGEASGMDRTQYDIWSFND